MEKLNIKPMNAKWTTMDAITILGLIAAAFTTVCLLPQLMKVYKTKSTKDISTVMFTLYSGGVLLWFIYGVYRQDIAIMIANSLALIQGIVILALKLKYN
jgi:MtN3 and saliva related transmembrane protein